jgi:plastocyanin
MSRASVLIGGVVAMSVACALVAGSGAVSRLFDPAPPVQAAMSHVMMDHAAEPTAGALVAAAANKVIIDNFSYRPATLSVAVGTKVIWTNDDADPHTVTSATDPRLLKSSALDTGDSFAFTFDKPGTYRYFCSLHPHMQGIIVVQ